MAAYNGEQQPCDIDNDSSPQSGNAKTERSLILEEYQAQTQVWPQSGQHILAHYDDETVVVYQAYKTEIAEYAVEHQRFGGPHFSFSRMSWIKTNFMWMMYRCGWAQKHNQGRVLAVWLTRNGFDEILAHAMNIGQKSEERIGNKVRLQWDPDHHPTGGNLYRRAIQLGLRRQILTDYATKFVVQIKDITDMVHEQYKNVSGMGKATTSLMCPRERIYIPSSRKISAQIGLDSDYSETK